MGQTAIESILFANAGAAVAFFSSFYQQYENFSRCKSETA